jgi:ABC-type phosphate transport system substrate-binding protein
VAGATTFPYDLVVGGRQVRNLRLSGLTLAKIFTNRIVNWDDPEITTDNNGRRLPSIPIIPVVHSEAAGSTLQFTSYLSAEYPTLWQQFAGSSSPTLYYPHQGPQVAEDGSNAVMNFVSSASGFGAIGYDELQYPLARAFPVAGVENAAGYFVAPTADNVAIALTQAQIDTNKASPDYLQENLSKVYSYRDARTYPLSSYDYAVIPTSVTDPTMSTGKRQSLADFLYYAVCQGQNEAGPIGDAPLTVNLVGAAILQIDALHTADPLVDVSRMTLANCHNPTFLPNQPTVNYLGQTAPQPPPCDRAGQGPCTGAPTRATCEGTLPANTTIGMATSSDGNGYWIASSSGAVASCGDAPIYGNGRPGTVAITRSPDGGGYWLVSSTGQVQAFGSAVNHGSIPASIHLAKPIVAMAADPATGGYWLLGGDGGVFAFVAPFYGSTGNIRLNKPAVGMAATPNGKGYYFVASDGGIFAYRAPFYGSTGNIALTKPVVGMALDPATGGYWMDAADGGIFSFHAPFYGSTGSIKLARPCVGMSAMPDGYGYRFVAADGGIFDFHAPFEGSAA